MEVSHENGTHRIKVGDDGEVEVQEVVSFGKEDGVPARLVGVFHPAGADLTIAKATKSHVSAFGIDFAFEGGSAFAKPLLLGRLTWRQPGSQRRSRRRLGSTAPSSACSARCSRSPSSPGWSPTTGWAGWSRPPDGLGSLGFYVTVWVVMMAAMMFPSVAPTVLMYDRLREGHRATRPRGRAGRDRAVRRRLPPRLDGGRPRRLRPVRARARHRPGLPGLGRGRPVGDRRRDRDRGDLSGDAVEAGLPRQVPEPDDVPRRALAARPRGRARAGRAAWRLVPRLLLGADGRPVRRGSHEPRLDGADRRLHRGEKLLPWPAAALGPWQSCCSSSDSASRSRPRTCPGFAEPGMSDARRRGRDDGMQMMR